MSKNWKLKWRVFQKPHHKIHAFQLVNHIFDLDSIDTPRLTTPDSSELWRGFWNTHDFVDVKFKPWVWLIYAAKYFRLQISNYDGCSGISMILRYHEPKYFGGQSPSVTFSQISWQPITHSNIQATKHMTYLIVRLPFWNLTNSGIQCGCCWKTLSRTGLGVSESLRLWSFSPSASWSTSTDNSSREVRGALLLKVGTVSAGQGLVKHYDGLKIHQRQIK